MENVNVYSGRNQRQYGLLTDYVPLDRQAGWRRQVIRERHEDMKQKKTSCQGSGIDRIFVLGKFDSSN